MPSVQFLRRAQFFRIHQEIFRIPREVFRCRQTHPVLACHPQGAEDNAAAVPCVGYGLRRFSASGVLARWVLSPWRPWGTFCRLGVHGYLLYDRPIIRSKVRID